MNIVKSDDNYFIYKTDSVSTLKKLPANTYLVKYAQPPMGVGFYLTEYQDLAVKEKKIYGNIEHKVDKVLNSFKLTDRNMGVILSGEKGSGKSLFAHILSEKAKKQKLPTIIVNEKLPKLSDFISSINQECIVLFDEFEKMYTHDKDDENDPQNELLSLFDGIDNGKKLYVLTCNEVDKLNKYYLNRPGRFHYHFIIGTPKDNEIEEYLHDNLKKYDQSVADKIIAVNRITNLTYDILRSICFELNQGYSLSESFEDLNISQCTTFRASINVRFANKQIGYSDRILNINLLEIDDNYLSKKYSEIIIRNPSDKFKYLVYDISIEFNIRDIYFDSTGYHINKDNAKFNFIFNGGDEDEDTEKKQEFNKYVEEFNKVESIDLEIYSKENTKFTV